MWKLTLEIEFDVGTLEELGLGGLRQSWVDASHEGREYSLTCGAGLGNTLLEGSVSDGDRAVYARSTVNDLAQKLFAALSEDFDAQQPAEVAEP
jgi:hypothetical protein